MCIGIILEVLELESTMWSNAETSAVTAGFNGNGTVSLFSKISEINRQNDTIQNEYIVICSGMILNCPITLLLSLFLREPVVACLF